jgi:hypothetical protein
MGHDLHHLPNDMSKLLRGRFGVLEGELCLMKLISDPEWERLGREPRHHTKEAETASYSA